MNQEAVSLWSGSETLPSLSRKASQWVYQAFLVIGAVVCSRIMCGPINIVHIPRLRKPLTMEDNPKHVSAKDTEDNVGLSSRFRCICQLSDFLEYHVTLWSTRLSAYNPPYAGASKHNRQRRLLSIRSSTQAIWYQPSRIRVSIRLLGVSLSWTLVVLLSTLQRLFRTAYPSTHTSEGRTSLVGYLCQ